MSVTFGFYNSKNHDRAYNSTHMSSLFDGIIRDGVFMTVGNQLAIEPSSGMIVTVGPGRAWFNHTWTNNDAKIPLSVPMAESVLHRIDAVVLEVNATASVRENTIKIIKGTPAASPIVPTMIENETVHQHLLGHIYVAAGTSVIEKANITNLVGTGVCPFVSGILETADVDSLYLGWEGQFEKWFENLENQLDDNQAANLQHQIDHRLKVEDKASIEEAFEGIDNNKYMTPLTISKLQRVGDIINTVNKSPGNKWALCNGEGIDDNLYPELASVCSLNLLGLWNNKTGITSNDKWICKDSRDWVYGVQKGPDSAAKTISIYRTKNGVTFDFFDFSFPELTFTNLYGICVTNKYMMLLFNFNSTIKIAYTPYSGDGISNTWNYLQTDITIGTTWYSGYLMRYNSYNNKLYIFASANGEYAYNLKLYSIDDDLKVELVNSNFVNSVYRGIQAMIVYKNWIGLSHHYGGFQQCGISISKDFGKTFAMQSIPYTGGNYIFLDPIREEIFGGGTNGSYYYIYKLLEPTTIQTYSGSTDWHQILNRSFVYNNELYSTMQPSGGNQNLYKVTINIPNTPYVTIALQGALPTADSNIAFQAFGNGEQILLCTESFIKGVNNRFLTKQLPTDDVRPDVHSFIKVKE